MLYVTMRVGKNVFKSTSLHRDRHTSTLRTFLQFPSATITAGTITHSSRQFGHEAARGALTAHCLENELLQMSKIHRFTMS